MEDPLLPVSAPAAGEEDTAAAAPPTANVAASPSSSSPAPSIPTSAVLVRVACVVVLALVSLWANYEASRGFGIAVVNGATGTAAGRRFDLMLVSNGRASRTVLDASRAVERALYPGGAGDTEAKKPVHHVTLRLADWNLSASVVVLPGGHGRDTHGENEFLLHVSSGVMLSADAGVAMRAAVRRGMARVWLWDGQGAAPEALLDAMAEYLSVSASLVDGAASQDPFGSAAATVQGGEEGPCWPAAAQGRDTAARFVRLCEAKSRGFVARLNRAMRGRWRPGMVEESLGSPPGWICRTQSTSAWGGGAASPVRDDSAGWAARSGHGTSQGWASR